MEAFLSWEVSSGSRGVVTNGEYNQMGHTFSERNRGRAYCACNSVTEF